MKGTFWSQEENNLLCELYAKEGSKTLSKQLNRSEESIRVKAKKLNLHYFPIKNFSLTLTPTEIGYIAGVLDGEGHIRLRLSQGKNGGRSISPIMLIANTNLELLNKCRKILGVGVIKKTNPSKKTAVRKQCYQLRILGIAKIKTILEILLPELTVKREQAKLILVFCKSRAIKPAKSPYTQDEYACVMPIHTLNKRGV
jgi:hypothetical protein